MNQTVTFKKFPGVLAFKRGHLISDALMFNQLDTTETPVQVIRHGIRATQNVNGKDTDVSNIQQTETAKLDNNTQIMLARFHLAFLPIHHTLNACVGKNKQESLDMRASIEGFLERTKNSEGLKEVARRYARNIANGRWLWRNRVIASDIRITVTQSNVGSGQQELACFNALKIPTQNFNDYHIDEIKVGEEIAEQMQGSSSATLQVEAIVTLRAPGVEVFPSQNYIEKKPKGFARPLYKVGHAEPATETDIRVMGQAAIRDQKVYNAIRTIDTWYPAFKEENFPIPVEPKGANLEMQEFYRNEKGTSSFDLFKRLNQIDPSSEEGMFCIASFERGGVYSESEKEADAKDKKVTAEVEE